MGSVAICVLVLALAGAAVSWAIGAVYYKRTLAALDGDRRTPMRCLAVAAWPFAIGRIDGATVGYAAVVNKAVVALLVCVTLAVATIVYSTNLNRFAR
jgi:hypothetical protein